MSLSIKITAAWSAAFWDAIGCGLTADQAEARANEATAASRAQLRRIERAQAPKVPRHTNLAGRRQAAERRA